MDKDFHHLYKSYLQGFKEIGGEQAVALCHNHQDTKQSLSIHFGKGLCNCFACGYKANAYQFATDVGHPNPREYIVDMNGDGVASQRPETSSVVAPKPKTSKPPTPPPDLIKLMEQYKTNLRNNMDVFPDDVWDVELIDKLGIGYLNGKWQFNHHDMNGNPITVREHKGVPVGDKKCKWYLKHTIVKHDHDKALYICEGEKDALVLYSHNYQVVCGTTGAVSIPKDENGNYDLEWIQYYNNSIYLVFDHDKSGYKGGRDMGLEIVQKYPSHDVQLAKWGSHLPAKFDIYDAFTKDNDAHEFYDALANAESLRPPAPERFGGLKFKSGVEVMKSKTEPTFEIVEAFLPQNQQTLIAGTKKANKSTMCMQMGMALANNEKQFLGFDINAQDMEVLYFDMEVGEPTFDYRFQKLATIFPDFENNGAKRFNRVCKVASDPNMIQRIDETVDYYRPDIVFIDPLYKITGGTDIGKAHHLFPITEGIDGIKVKYNTTVAVVHHLLKGNHELGLQDDRMAGSSQLGFWMEHCVLITKTNEPFLRMLTWGDTRNISTPDKYYGLEFDPSNYSLTNRGTVDWEKYLLTKKKIKAYEYYLSFMDDEFTTDDWHKSTWADEVPASTSEKWLSHMVKCKLIERPAGSRYGKYKKKLTEIVDVTERG